MSAHGKKRLRFYNRPGWRPWSMLWRLFRRHSWDDLRPEVYAPALSTLPPQSSEMRWMQSPFDAAVLDRAVEVNAASLEGEWR
jgi:hypothetical protein